MTIADERNKQGRQPFEIVEIDLDYCQETYGVAPCQAGTGGGVGGVVAANQIQLSSVDARPDNYYNGKTVRLIDGTGSGQSRTITAYVSATKIATVSVNWTTPPDTTSVYGIADPDSELACYNTRSTCQDPSNYNPAAKTYRFCTMGGRLPTGDTLIPCVISSTIQSPEINLNQSIGLKGSATILLEDFIHNDRGIDKNLLNRTLSEPQGTYLGRLRARNLYYQSRPIRIYKGYFTNPIDLANFDKYEYFIDRLEINRNGQLKVIAKDPLKLAGNDRAVCPVASTGTLLADIDSVQLTAVLSPTGIGDDEYPTGTFRIRINDEVCIATRVATSDSLAITRSEHGSTASGHSLGDIVQLCQYWEDINVVDIIDDLVQIFAEIPSTYIPSADWTAQKEGLLSSNRITALISEPEGVEDLLNELIRDNLINLYWNDRTSEIILRNIIPDDINLIPDPISEEDNIVWKTIEVKDEPKARISRVRMVFSPRDATAFGENSDFEDAYIAADSDAEGVNQFGEKRIKTIFTRWFSTENRGIVIQTSSRLLQRYRNNPFKIKFSLDPKDGTYSIGDSFTLDSKRHQDTDGTNKTERMQVISVQPPKKIGDNFKYNAASVAFAGNFGFIAPAGMSDFSAATDEEKQRYAWIARADGTMLDGSPGYLII